MASTEAYVDEWEAAGRPDGRAHAWREPVGVYRGDYVFMTQDENGRWHLP